jgi:Fe-S-cluster containining protein
VNLPCLKCKGRCCTEPAFTPDEFSAVVSKLPANSSVRMAEQVYNYDGTAGKVFILSSANGKCPFLVHGRCSIYEQRPKVCVDYGIVPELPCEFLFPKLAEKKMKERIKKAKRETKKLRQLEK